ncbi:hypothetical protein KC332_g8892 [Hortaea werneckii]|uniref:Uncharacterized protein n=1 Tax=Hortaea werneckii TaxID=91943 RepID=A0A3M7I3V4_HORWE|nr:hypothetical protein KC358_g8251 [Hortaea werneckii]KAI6830381.1 hypothetical protein KC350_g7599 [Hortaea werneckii]KAI6926766.1 hypothetical protein KC348_g8574 [Hortaea werneckii]KAI6932865.1 hypothetical protein KC341_g8717 [Hortaea werneckii]KAI6957862.1 hypothetical protein KC321_g14339 [Hortaea werneckii]
MFYYPPPPPPANIFHFAPGPYCSIPGPVGINALFTYPPLLSQNTAAPAQTEEKAATKEKPKAPTKKILIPPLPPPPAAAPAISTTKSQKKEDPASAKEDSKPKEEKKEEKKEDKKEDKKEGKKEEKKDTKPEEKSKEEPKKKKKVINTYLPPKIPVGTNFWFAAEFTQLHIFNKGVKIWEERWRGDRKAFKAFTVDIHWPVRSIIERTRYHNNAETTTEQQAAACNGWAVTEVIEVGDNTFFKGTTVAYGSDKAKVSLASMGWNGKRGKSLPPVWLTVHKI